MVMKYSLNIEQNGDECSLNIEQNGDEIFVEY